MVSESEGSAGEWRTIRIAAPAYHKLLELSSFMTLITLSRTTPISVISEWAITAFYDKEFPRLKESVADPKKSFEASREIALGLKRVYDARDQWKAILEEQEKRRG